MRGRGRGAVDDGCDTTFDGLAPDGWDRDGWDPDGWDADG